MKILVASTSILSHALAEHYKAQNNQVDCVDCCETMDGVAYDMVVYDSIPTQEDRYAVRDGYSHLLDFSDVVVTAYRLTNDHPGALHVVMSSDEALYLDGGFYGKNRKLVEDVYALAGRYLVVRCAQVLGNAPNDLLDRLLGYQPIPYTPDSQLQFVSLQDVVTLTAACVEGERFQSVVTAAGRGCVTIEELCKMAGVTSLVADGARRLVRDCDSTSVTNVHALKHSKDYAMEYIGRKKNLEATNRG